MPITTADLPGPNRGSDLGQDPSGNRTRLPLDMIMIDAEAYLALRSQVSQLQARVDQLLLANNQLVEEIRAERRRRQPPIQASDFIGHAHAGPPLVQSQLVLPPSAIPTASEIMARAYSAASVRDATPVPEVEATSEPAPPAEPETPAPAVELPKIRRRRTSSTPPKPAGPPFGYYRNAEGKWVELPWRADAIRIIAEKRQQGFTLRQIADQVRRVFGVELSTGTVDRISRGTNGVPRPDQRAA